MQTTENLERPETNGAGGAAIEVRGLVKRFGDLVAPMRRSSLLISFGTARFVLMVVEILILVSAAIWLLGVPLRGSLFSFAVICLLGSMSFAAFGIMIASRARTMEGISGLMNLAMMPMWLFSGVFFSAERFPEATQPFIAALPLTALNDALRV